MKKNRTLQNGERKETRCWLTPNDEISIKFCSLTKKA